MTIIVGGQCVGNSPPSCVTTGRPKPRAALGISSAIGAILALCAGFAATEAVAGSTQHKRNQTPHSTPAVQHRSGRHIVAHQPVQPGYGRSLYQIVPAAAFVQPDTHFVPGRGIEGESCDLPPSACPNDVRIAN
jgi:hypothetical protein